VGVCVQPNICLHKPTPPQVKECFRGGKDFEEGRKLVFAIVTTFFHAWAAEATAGFRSVFVEGRSNAEDALGKKFPLTSLQFPRGERREQKGKRARKKKGKGSATGDVKFEIFTHHVGRRVGFEGFSLQCYISDHCGAQYGAHATPLEKLCRFVHIKHTHLHHAVDFFFFKTRCLCAWDN
jgi:hypothetical protein